MTESNETPSRVPRHLRGVARECYAMVEAGRSIEEAAATWGRTEKDVREFLADPTVAEELHQWRAERDRLRAEAERLQAECRLPDVREALPSAAVLSLEEAVTWIATGKAWSPDELQQYYVDLANKVGNWGDLALQADPTHRLIELACQELLEAAREKKLPLYGRRENEGEHRTINIEALVGNVTIAPTTASIEEDYSRLSTQDFMIRRKHPFTPYREVRVHREDLERVWGHKVPTPRQSRNSEASDKVGTEIQEVLNAATTLFGADSSRAPSANEAAKKILSSDYYKGKYGFEAIRKILRGAYDQQTRRGIPGYYTQDTR